MSKLLLAFALTLVLVSAASAQYVYTSQDWQDGVGSWALFGTAGTTQPVLVNDAITDQLEEGNIALKTMALTTGTAGNARFELPLLATKTWQLTWDFYAVGGATREFAMAYSYSGGSSAGTLQALTAWGNYNTPLPTGFYHFRIAFGPTANPLNFAKLAPQSATQNWGVADVAYADNAWHTMSIAQQDLGNGDALLKYYIDGALVARWATTADFAPTSIRMGSALSNGGFSAYYDNISLVVPEPASMLALGTGLNGLLGLVRRRRA